MRSILANSHSLLHRGHTERVLSHRWMQSRWKTCPQQPKAIDSPFSLLGEGFAWYSMLGSFRELRQMAHVSAQMSQLHMHTAFHFLISNLGGGASFCSGFLASSPALSSTSMADMVPSTKLWQTRRARKAGRCASPGTLRARSPCCERSSGPLRLASGPRGKVSRYARASFQGCLVDQQS